MEIVAGGAFVLVPPQLGTSEASPPIGRTIAARRAR